MDDLLRSLNYDNPNFYNDYIQKLNPQLDEFSRYIRDSPNKNQIVLNIITLLVKLTSSTRIETKEDLEKESGQIWIFERFTPYIDPDHLTQDDVSAILRIFAQIENLNYHTRVSIKVFTLLMRNFRNTKFIENTDDRTLALIIKSIRFNFRLELKYFLACRRAGPDSDMKDLSIGFRDEQFRSQYRFVIEDFFDHLGEDRFTRLLPHIQDYYEFCIRNHNNIFVPNQFISDKIIRIVGYFKTHPPNSLYYDLPTNPNSSPKIRQMIDLFKNILIDANHSEDDLYCNYSNSSVKNFGSQIIEILSYADPKNGHKIFVENWHYWIDACFDIFTKATRNDSRCAIYNLDLRKLYAKSKLKDIKKFNLFICEKLLECTRFLAANWKEIDSKNVKNSPEYANCLECYFNFSRPYVNYIQFELNDIKGCCQILIDTLLELSKLAPLSTDCLRIIAELLYKDNFYVFKDYLGETVTLTRNLVEIAYEFSELDGDLVEAQKARYEAISKTYGYLKERLSKFPESVQVVQECLFDKLFFKPVELNLSSSKFFYLINHNLFDVFKGVELIQADKTQLKKLTTAVELFLSHEILESLQPDHAPKMLHRERYFESWFFKLGQILKTLNQIDPHLAERLVQIIDRVEEFDNYVNVFDVKSFTINYQIVQSLSWVLYNPNASEILVKRLVQVWVNLYEMNIEDFNRNFYHFIRMVGQLYGGYLVPFGDKLWSFYLNNSEEYNLLAIVDLILPLTEDIFMKKYSKLFFDKILLNFDQDFLKSYSLFIRIFKVCPNFYIQSVNEKLYLTLLVEKSKLSAVGNIQATVYGLFTQFISALKESEKFEKDFHLILYQHRNEFWKFVLNEKQSAKNQVKYEVFRLKDFSTEWVVTSIGEIYYIILRNTTNKDKRRQLARTFVNELLGYLTFTEPIEDRPFRVIDILRGIGEFENKMFLDIVREHREFFVGFKNEVQTNPNAINSVNAILDLIDGRNLESFSNKLTENEQNILKINENLLEKDAEIKALDQNVRLNEQNITTLKGDVVQINQKIDTISKQIEEQNSRIDKLDEKTLFNIPSWCRLIKESITKNNQDWILIAKRLNFSDRDIKGWLNQIDPFMSMMQEWFLQNKTSDAILGLMKTFKELNNKECIHIIQENLDRIEEESKSHFKDYNIDDKMKKNPSHIFICYEASSRDKARLLQRYLFEHINKECGVDNLEDPDNRINIWFDDADKGGGVERNKRIDLGLRLCSVLVCLITEETNKDQTCLNQINMAVQLSKPIVPLLLDSRLKWPPSGSLGPILSEYLFIRFFQRPKELTNDERYWPVEKFHELTMQLKQLIPFSVTNTRVVPDREEKKKHPEVFISYQWDKQKEIVRLYEKLTKLGLKCWLDIYQMGGGDSLYFKIDEGLRNCRLVISCVTTKYSQSANCRKEVALAHAINKPIIPILIEDGMSYPPSGPMSPILGEISFVDFTKNKNKSPDMLWEQESFIIMLEKMKASFSDNEIKVVTSRACTIS